MTEWLPLMEYSNKHKVSLSTLRRRIKSDEIQFRLDDGKYFILDEAPVERPGMGDDEAVNLQAQNQNLSQQNESVLEAANRLLNELKQAYSRILQEKEEQIMQLKEELSDLKTLVRVLESENERLNKR